jgi:hypothetical protein
MANRFYLKTRAAAAVAENNFPSSCAATIELALADTPDENVEAALITWFDDHAEYKKTSQPIDIELERRAFGKDATPGGRAKAHNVYGPEFFNVRREAWGASEGTIRSGTEPGVSSEETVKKAEKIVAASEQFANSPFNPQKRYLTEQSRQNEIVKYIGRFGTKSAQAAAAKFGVDLAGRPLRKRA